jgi:hypothetical protein
MHVLNPEVHRADKAEGPALRGHVDDGAINLSWT